MKQLKIMWGYYLSLLFVILILSFPLFWIYEHVHDQLGTQSAVLALFGMAIVVVLLGVSGGVFTHRFVRILRREITNSGNQQLPERCKLMYVLKMLRIEHGHNPAARSHSREIIKSDDKLPYEFPICPRKRRGKQPRFPQDKIRKAVLKWESRDPSFSVQTLEEFLDQEFGSGPDGILLMATTTFYDWRRRILNEMKQAYEDNP